jgi:hypothetical protein
MACGPLHDTRHTTHARLAGRSVAHHTRTALTGGEFGVLLEEAREDGLGNQPAKVWSLRWHSVLVRVRLCVRACVYCVSRCVCVCRGVCRGV